MSQLPFKEVLGGSCMAEDGAIWMKHMEVALCELHIGKIIFKC